MIKNNIRLAIIDNAIDHKIYRPVEHWTEFINLPWEAFHAKKSSFPNLQDFTHIILTGSEASILERQEWVYEEIEVVQEAVEKGLSILGSCYGHQLLALALTGPKNVRRCERPEMGWIPIEIDTQNTFLGRETPAFTLTLHFDEVADLGDEFDVFARTPGCAVQAFQKKGFPIWGLQPHPEINIKNGQQLLKNLIEKNAPASHQMEESLLMEPCDSGLIHYVTDNFFSI
ncbi:type 1 glutamine amidotransferase [Acidobacteriota bacterium]